MASLVTSKGDKCPCVNHKIALDISDSIASLKVVQIYVNDGPEESTCKFSFPKHPKATIIDIRANYDGKEILCDIEEKEAAEKIFEKAREDGKKATLGLAGEEYLSIHLANVGPGVECTVTTHLVLKCDMKSRAFEYFVPLFFIPKYVPKDTEKEEDVGPQITANVIASEFIINGKCGCNIKKALINEKEITVKDKHEFFADMSDQENLIQGVTIKLETEDETTWAFKAHSDGLFGAFGCSFTSFTDFLTKEQKEDMFGIVKTDIVFILDCSGSMSGGEHSPIARLRDAMKLLVQSLPEQVHFGVILFGSTYETLFDGMKQANQENVDECLSLINDIDANLGGTVLLPALKYAMEYGDSDSKLRQLFVLTDGEVANVNAVIDYVDSVKKSCRIFSFGIGKYVSHTLVDGIANASNGRSVYIDNIEEMRGIVVSQLENALRPSITNLKAKFFREENGEKHLYPCVVVPPVHVPVFPGDGITFHGFRPKFRDEEGQVIFDLIDTHKEGGYADNRVIEEMGEMYDKYNKDKSGDESKSDDNDDSTDDGEEGELQPYLPTHIEITGYLNDEEYRKEYELTQEGTTDVVSGAMKHIVAGSLIRELESVVSPISKTMTEEDRRKASVLVSIWGRCLCKSTGFVGVECNGIDGKTNQPSFDDLCFGQCTAVLNKLYMDRCFAPARQVDDCSDSYKDYCVEASPPCRSAMPLFRNPFRRISEKISERKLRRQKAKEQKKANKISAKSASTMNINKDASTSSAKSTQSKDSTSSKTHTPEITQSKKSTLDEILDLKLDKNQLWTISPDGVLGHFDTKSDSYKKLVEKNERFVLTALNIVYLRKYERDNESTWKFIVKRILKANPGLQGIITEVESLII